MTGLVEEIQTLAIDPSAQVSDLLRKVKLAATKLKLDDAVKWIDLELEGYRGVEDKDVPIYRQFNGQLMEQSPHHGRRPAHGDAETIRGLSWVVLKEPISSLEHLTKSTNNLQLPIDVDFEKALQKTMGNRSFYISFGQNVLIGILSHVKDMVLNWAIELEKAGVLGEGISFTMEEKEKAAEVSPSITIHGNVGQLHQVDVSGNQNRIGTAGTDNSSNSLEINNTFDQVINAVNSSIGNENDRREIVKIIEAMKETQGTEEYKPHFQKWVGYVADYATILGPFVPALAAMVI